MVFSICSPVYHLLLLPYFLKIAVHGPTKEHLSALIVCLFVCAGDRTQGLALISEWEFSSHTNSATLLTMLQDGTHLTDGKTEALGRAGGLPTQLVTGLESNLSLSSGCSIFFISLKKITKQSALCVVQMLSPIWVVIFQEIVFLRSFLAALCGRGHWELNPGALYH